MKKKIIIGLSIFSLIFFFGGIYLIFAIETATSKLDDLVMLHQVEILREQLLLQIKRVQSDINLKNTRFARNIDTVVTNFRNMEHMADTCLDCHHSEEMLNRLEDLRNDVEVYKKAVSRLFTIRANTRRLTEEEDKAFRTGEHLITQVNNMISMATINLENKTRVSLREISHTKTILYVLIVVMPFLAGGLGFVFIQGFTKPVNILLNATRKLEGGDLDFKIEGLTGEFGEVASSFNEMARSLQEHMHKIEESEKRYRMLFESAGDAIFMVDIEGENMGHIVSANQAAADMHGYTVEEMLTLNLVKDLDTPESAKEAPDRIKKIMEGEWIKIEIAHRRKDGSVFPVEACAGLLEFMGHRYILAIDRDISERKKAQEVLLRSYTMFTTVLDSIDSIIYVADMNSYEVLYLNRYGKDIFGSLEGEICWKTLQTDQSAPCGFCSNDKLLDPDGRPSGVYKWEFQNTSNGRWYDIHDRAIDWIDGRIVRMEIATDITERKKMEEDLRRSEQMRLVGEWATGLAHEIKNSLAGIKISVEVLSDDPDVPDEDKESILKAIDEIRRIELLLKSLLYFARPPKLQLFVTDVNEIIENAIDFSLMQSALPREKIAKINIVKDFSNNLPSTVADRLQLRQVFMNILINACQSMEDGGTITVTTSYNTEADAIEVNISDTGEGINENAIKKIFQPFFTTKSKGTGLGLAITKRILEHHGGEISVENRPGGGAVFSVSLPVKHSEKEQTI